ncbi:dihydrofolate reductase family protein [Glycomyces sp. TRM65418]|nr:dihydrofolate reductase family protein [Glycomyces sp. TRM65418]MCC3762002.1 dihydrofolate reductase family protein [Glycomyces sp. TRM65418]QZD56077.1 dihydrofolate reductase family protein [Glycomyces sp. TRM65418]
MERPYVIVSAAMSLDGYLDDTSSERLVLSNAADFDRVDAVRADVDAIAVGAGTVRADDPRLQVRSETRRAHRVAAGRPASPLRVVFSPSGELDPGARLFTGGDRVVVYTSEAGMRACPLAPEAAEVIATADRDVDLEAALADLARRGVRRLLVEGGGVVHTAFLSADLVDEMHLAVAPFLLGARGGARFVHPAVFPQSPERPLELAETRAIGDLALMRYRRAGVLSVYDLANPLRCPQHRHRRRMEPGCPRPRRPRTARRPKAPRHRPGRRREPTPSRSTR